MKLFHILQNTKTFGEVADVEIKNISNDSRDVAGDDLFIAFSGYETDRHNFIGDAHGKGCRYFLVDKNRIGEFEKEYPSANFIGVENGQKVLSAIAKNFYGDPSDKLKLVGITGTNGKTTTAFVVYLILRKLGKSAGLIGTIEYRINDEIIPATNTTPDVLQLNHLMAEMVKKKVEYLVMEVSSHALSLGRVDELNFDIVGFTNFTQDHLDYHKTMEEYLDAKLKIFDLLEKSNKKNKTAILNKDSDRFKEIYSRASQYSYSIKTISLSDSSSDYFASGIKTNPSKSIFEINDIRAEILMIGVPNIYNFTFAVAIASELGFSLEDMVGGILDIKVRGRMESVKNNRGVNVAIDYAHTPDGLEGLLSALREIVEPNKEIITVFGCGGDRDKTKRSKMGEIAGRLSDYAIITSDNPRTEDAMLIIKDIEKGFGVNSCQYEVVADRVEAIKEAFAKASPGDIIAIAGKGHEDYQIIGKEKFHFSDREVAENVD